MVAFWTSIGRTSMYVLWNTTQAVMCIVCKCSASVAQVCSVVEPPNLVLGAVTSSCKAKKKKLLSMGVYIIARYPGTSMIAWPAWYYVGKSVPLLVGRSKKRVSKRFKGLGRQPKASLRGYP